MILKSRKTLPIARVYGLMRKGRRLEVDYLRTFKPPSYVYVKRSVERGAKKLDEKIHLGQFSQRRQFRTNKSGVIYEIEGSK